MALKKVMGLTLAWRDGWEQVCTRCGTVDPVRFTGGIRSQRLLQCCERTLELPRQSRQVVYHQLQLKSPITELKKTENQGFKKIIR